MPWMKAITDAACTDFARLSLALLLVGGTLALLLLRVDVPVALYGFDGMALGFYFGGLTQRNSA